MSEVLSPTRPAARAAAARQGAELVQLAEAFMRSRLLLSAVELGVFEGLGVARRSAAELGSAIGADPRALAILLDGLAAIGLLEKDGELYASHGAVGALFSEGEPTYEAAALRRLAALWPGWSDLTEAVRTGRPTLRRAVRRRRRDLAEALQRQAQRGAGELARLLGGPDVRRVLDVGSGAGAISIALAEAHPHCEAVLIDSDSEALRLARKAIRSGRLGRRVRARQADFLRDDLGGEYDLALLSSVVCLHGPEENRRLLGRVHAALGAGGRVVIRDWILAEDRVAPSDAALFAVNMLVHTPSGRAYTASELRGWLADAGFGRVHQLPASPLPLLLGTRPG